MRRERVASRSHPLLRSGAILLCGVLASTLALVPPAAAERDLEPAPPWIFFPEPDETTAREIDDQIARFADLNQAPAARDVLVRRFGLWSVPRLVRALGTSAEVSTSEPIIWNAELTMYVLRDRFGNARELWPVIPPLIDLARDGDGQWQHALAALSLGAFRGPAFAPPLPIHKDETIVRVPEQVYGQSLDQAIQVLGTLVDHFHPETRVAAALALAKSGAEGARALLRVNERLAKDAEVPPRQAVLLAVGLLPLPSDEDLLLHWLEDDDTRIRQAAALACALQAVGDRSPPWVSAPTRVLRALGNTGTIRLQLQDGAEAVFARGVLAARDADTDEWRALFRLAMSPYTQDTTARAAAQTLLFCKEPWLLPEALERLQSQIPDPSVVAACLLRFGASGSHDGLDFCRKYLGNPNKEPRGKPEWDVRYHAVVGILRGLADRRFETVEDRQHALDALDAGMKRGLPAGPFRDALGRVLDHERRRLIQVPDSALPRDRVLEVEESVRDPYGLFAHDIADVAIRRLNDMLPLLFSVPSVRATAPGEPDKSGMPRRYFDACQSAWPYFSRLDLQADRGLRPPPVMVGSQNPDEEVRR